MSFLQSFHVKLFRAQQNESFQNTDPIIKQEKAELLELQRKSIVMMMMKERYDVRRQGRHNRLVSHHTFVPVQTIREK